MARMVTNEEVMTQSQRVTQSHTLFYIVKES